MMDPSQMPPTRTSLLELRRGLEEALHGHDLLERKREVLLRELWGMVREAEDIEPKVRRCFERAYAAAREARLLMGSQKLEWAGMAPACRTVYSAEVRNVMGVELPRPILQLQPVSLPYSPAGVSTGFAELVERWIEVGRLLGSWVQALGGIARLTRESEKTHRRVNALKYILIPQYRIAIERIRSILEEQERDSFLRAKRVKLGGQDQSHL